MKTLHVVADSISMHYGPYLERYIGKLYKYSRKGSIKIGALNPPGDPNGRDSVLVLEYLSTCVTEEMKWDVLLLNCGLHDIRYYESERKNQVPLANYEANLNGIYSQAHKLANNLIWVRITPVIDRIHNPVKPEYKRYNADVEKYNQVADKLAKQNDAWVIDLYSFCQSMGDAENYADHIHFTNIARHLQGAFVAGHLLSLFPHV